MFWIYLCFTYLFFDQLIADAVRYDGHKFQRYRILPRKLNHLGTFNLHRRNLTSSDQTTPFEHIHNPVPPTNRRKPTRIVEQPELGNRPDTYDWSGYHTLDETYKWLESLVDLYPDQVEMLIGGRTYEGRQIRGVRVSFNTDNKGIFLEGGIHAREWISPATVTYMLNEILTNMDPAIREIVEKFDWYIFPHYNPDGFVYTHTTDRLWRKTRSKGTKCDGADPNRNWDIRWMENGASNDECASTYGGKRAFSEMETRTLSEFLLTLRGKIHTYIAFHSFRQVVVYPYAGSSEEVPNHAHLQQIGEATVRELSKRYGTQYAVGPTYEVIYPAAGSSSDWVYGVLNVPVVFTYELRPQSSINGYVLPSSEILPTGQETFDSVLAMIRETEQLGYYD